MPAIARRPEGTTVLKLKDIMTSSLLTVTPQTSLREAMEVLSENHISGVPVTRGAKVVGVFSATDLLDYLAEFDESRREVGRPFGRMSLDDTTVAEVMTRVVQSLSPDCSVEHAAEFMRKAQIHRVLVMDDGELRGIVTTTDVAKAVAEHRIGRTKFVFA
jgi:CBS domain-containing protein